MKKLGTLIVALFVLPMFAWAQEDTGTETKTTTEAPTEATTDAVEATEEMQQKASGSKVEKIQVTGSHIKRIDVEGPSPVLTLDRDYLNNTGYNSVGDVLRDTTVASLGGLRESALSGGAATGASTTSLRGFGAGDILVLLDGRRLPTIGGGTSVDLNLIPMSAIDRIEILKDGASAIYGSDALGGVINFITRKNMDGGSIMIQQSVPEEAGGNKTDVVGTYGKTGSKYSFLSVLQYKKNEKIWVRDRDFAGPRLEDFSVFGSPGSWSDDDGATFNAGGNADPCPAGQNDNGICRFNYGPFMQIIPDTEQFSGLLNGTYDINESVKLNARMVYVHREVNGQLAPPPDRFFDNTEIPGGQDTRVPQNTFNNIWNAGTAGGPVTVFYRLVDEAGPRVSEVKTDTYAVDLGASGYFLDSWEWNVSTNYGFSQTGNKGVSGFAVRSELLSLANSGNFNPFAAPGNKDNISSAFYQPLEEVQSSIGGVLASATGELFDMPAGPLSLAVGVMSNWQTYEEGADAITAGQDQWGGGTASTGRGTRDFQSAYMEFSIPPFRGMEVQAAGRFDNFSDFGSTVNPKLAFRYKPVNMLIFRGSWGTGFKAPALSSLYGDTSLTFPQATDPIANESKQFPTVGGGNPNLREETSESFNIGAVIEPFKRFTFTVDHYIVNQDSIVSNLATGGGLRDIFRAEQQFGNSYLNGFGIDVQRVSPNGPISTIVAPNVNLSRREIKGLDFRAAYAPNLFGSWNLNLVVDHSVLLEVIEEPFPGLGKENRSGFQGYPFWKNYVTLGINNSNQSFNFIVKTIGEQNASIESIDPGAFGKTRDHTEVDFRYSYNLPWQGIVAVGALNIFGTERPLSVDNGTSGAGYLNAEIYDPVGRAYYVNYTQNF